MSKELTKEQLFITYGYLMDEEHGQDEELLCDIMKECGFEVEVKGDLFIVTE